MGYAAITPYSFLKSCVGSSGSDWITVTNLQADYAIGDITTFDYSHPIDYAYVDFLSDSRKDTSGSENYLKTTWLGYVALDDGITTQNCGLIGRWLFTPANGFIGQCRITTSENIASYLRPNTLYHCYLKDVGAQGANLVIHNPRLEILMFGGVT